MDRVTLHIRTIVNAYYTRPREMSKAAFCKANKLRVYQLDRMLALTGQRLMPGLTDLTRKNLAVYCGESVASLEGLWRQCSELIAVEVSNKERSNIRRHRNHATEFEHQRFRLLVDIAMMPSSETALAVMQRVHKEVLDEYPF